MALDVKDLECGDVVRLNGGKMLMTVDRLDDGKVITTFEDVKDGLSEAEFDPRMLTFICKADPHAARASKK